MSILESYDLVMADVRANNNIMLARQNSQPEDGLEQLVSEIESSNLITCKCDLDCVCDYTNLIEWLSLYYTITPKVEAE